MARACVHYNCPSCGRQKVCFNTVLTRGDVLTCSEGHHYVLNEAQREKVNLAFKTYINAQVEVYI